MRCNGIKSHFYCDCDYLYYGLLDYDSIEQIGLWNEWTVKLIFSLYKEHDKFQFIGECEPKTHAPFFVLLQPLRPCVQTSNKYR